MKTLFMGRPATRIFQMPELSDEEYEDFLELRRNKATLSKIAKKEDAWTLVASSIRSVLTGVAIILTAVWALWDNFKALITAAVK